MPTSVGHALAGLSVSWSSDAIRKRKTRALAIACALAAASPDLDILFHQHRRYTHSVGAAGIAGLCVWLILRLKQRRSLQPDSIAPRYAAITVGAAYGTHVLLDWLGKDSFPPYGLMALWPFSTRFYISGANLFMEISRRYWRPEEFIFGNLAAIGWEIAFIGPIALLAWLTRRSTTKAGGERKR